MSEFTGKSVYIVDDSEKIRAELRLIYKKLGLEVLGEGVTGKDAVDSLKNIESFPDIISMDIIMPQMHGIDSMRAIRSFNPDAKFLIVSILAGDHGVQNSLASDLPKYCFIAKPLHIGDLRNSLRQVFDLTSPDEESPDESASSHNIDFNIPSLN